MNAPRLPRLSRRALLGSAAVAAAVGLPSPAGAAPRPDAIDAEVDRLEGDLVAFRRDLHAHPEGPGDESRTAARVAAALRDAGLSVTASVGGHGVVGVLRGRHRGRTVAYRADMDAVPAEDQIGGGTAPLHLCGHDIHTTVGVGAAQVLSRLRHRLHGAVVFVFQPAEETLEGARAMIDAGVLAAHRPEEVHALHCGPMPVGMLGINPGSGLPGQDRGTVTLTGADAAGRAARLAADIAALATVAVPQDSADLERLIADLQVEDGPLAEFVYTRAQAEDGTVSFSSRCWPEDRYTEVRAGVDALAQAYGARAAFPADPFPAMVLPAPEAYGLKRFLDRRDVETAVVHAAIPFSGEDFALFLDEIPGTYTYLGVRSPGADIATSYPHFPTFDPDEASIAHGVRAMSAWLAERTSC
ncbi:M20 family metallopeptidase [Glycomyces mayteni]|uniref:M20 family metallopeptidase n=1 Tax=Glycomyces mayteni TaxID=543887 RepID=A0ABW2DDV6_9ACTN|nr:M20 family metallopeptidase [Glycomyces mayteni]